MFEDTDLILVLLPHLLILLSHHPFSLAFRGAADVLLPRNGVFLYLLAVGDFVALCLRGGCAELLIVFRVGFWVIGIGFLGFGFVGLCFRCFGWFLVFGGVVHVLVADYFDVVAIDVGVYIGFPVLFGVSMEEADSFEI
jgi:hypothetical protein